MSSNPKASLQSMVSAKPVLFIVGVGRSGTTLVQSMLNAHPTICFPPETAFLRLHLFNGRAEKVFQQNGLDGLLELVRTDEYLPRLADDIEAVTAAFVDQNNGFSALAYYEMLLGRYTAVEDGVQVGDKDPRLIEFLPAVKRIYPAAYIIHVIRDPRDTIVSRMKASWSQGRSFLNHLFVYNTQLRMGRRNGIKFFGDQYSEVCYEHLLAEPEETLSALCDSLGIVYDPAMLEFNRSAQKIVAKDELQWKSTVLGPLLTNNQRKWEGVLDEGQVALAESLCGDILDEFGYPKTASSSLSASAGSSAIGLAGKLYGIYRNYEQ